MAKSKCIVCEIWHGGFHLCNGAPVDLTLNNLRPNDQRYDVTKAVDARGFEGKSRGPATRWERVWAQEKERDLEIARKYREGTSMKDIASEYSLMPNKVRSVILRLGGQIRTRSEANLLRQAKNRKDMKGLQF